MTAKLLTGAMIVVLAALASTADAGPMSEAAMATLATVVVAQTAPANPLPPDRQAQTQDLLRRARQAMAENDLGAAEALIAQAESLGVDYNLFYMGDTPKRARKDLEQRKATAAAPAGNPPFGSGRNDTPPADPFAGRNMAAPAAAPGLVRLPTVDASPIPSGDAMASNQMLLAARRALAVGDVQRAAKFVQQAKGMPVARGANDDMPEAVEGSIRRYNELMSLPGDRKNTEGFHREYARLMLEQADGLLRRGDCDEAERLANEAIRQGVTFSPLELAPDTLLQRVAAVRRQGPMAVGGSGYAVIAAGGQQGAAADSRVAAAVYNPANDPTRNIPAGNFQEAAPQPGGNGNVQMASRPADGNPAANLGMQLFEQGEAALRNHDRDTALRCFRDAWAYRDQLDPVIAQRLQDHLQLMAAPAVHPAVSPAVSDTAAKQQVLIHQVQAEVAQQESAAKALMASNPKQALATMEQARARVEEAGLDPSTRDQLLRRVDRTLGDMRKFVEENQPKIELEDKNKGIRDEISRKQKAKVEVEEKTATLVNEYNRLNDDKRFEEARVVAKRAEELDPQNPVVRQIVTESNLIYNFNRALSVRKQKEQGFLDQLHNVDVAAVGFDDNKPYQFPEAKDWHKLSDGRLRKMMERRHHRSERELEIESKLKTPISLQFENAPLSQILEYLGKYCQVNIYLDPQGMADEGVTADTPVTIKLQHEISLKSALSLILQPLKLNYVIKDEVLKVTSEQLRGGDVYQVVYNVADLVIPIPNFVPSSNSGLAGQLDQAMSRNGYGGNNALGAPAPSIAAVATKGRNLQVNPAVMAQMPGSMSNGSGAAGGSTGTTGGPGGLGGATQADFDSLIELITSTVKPTSWDTVGGPGSIAGFETNLSLVVSQTQEVHEEIVDLLEQLRKLQDLQVTVEVRFITLEDDFFERIGVDFNFEIPTNIDRPYQIFGQTQPGASNVYSAPSSFTTMQGVARNVNTPNYNLGNQSVTVGLASPNLFNADMNIPFSQNSYGSAVPQFGGFDPTMGGTLGFAILSDIQAYFFIQAIQGDNRSNILQAPKVTLFNGQQAFVSDTSQSPFVISVIPVVGEFAAAQQPVIVVLSAGTTLTVQAVVSNDRRFVRLTVVPFFSNIGAVNTFTFTGSQTTSDTTSTQGNQTTVNDNSRNSSASTTSQTGTTVQLPTFAFVTVTTTVSVPDGGTVLLGGIKRLSEGRNEYGIPMLDKIPYINRLFKNVGIGRTTQSLMMMVTPRIIIQEEEEERLGIE
jgi:general secretion pathway protein D